MASREITVSVRNETSPRRRQILLKRIPLLRRLPEKTIAALATKVQDVHTEYGQILSKEGDPQSACYVVIRGSIKVGDARGESIQNEGAVLNQGALVDPTQPSLKITSLGAYLLMINGADLAVCLAANPKAQRIFEINKARYAASVGSRIAG